MTLIKLMREEEKCALRVYFQKVPIDDEESPIYRIHLTELIKPLFQLNTVQLKQIFFCFYEVLLLLISIFRIRS